jgi:serine/threonine protein kinase/tetratricopeptide (TPR) repeat protein
MEDEGSTFGTKPDRLDRLVFEVMAEPDEQEETPPVASLDMLVEKVGSWIDRYKLLSVLGEGGMGVVYLAEQAEPIKRRVALKVIKPGMDTKRVIARFEAERQALALLDHPNIAHVHDAGTTEAGHPYFVMEYVEGLPITDYCDTHKLTIEARLRVFLHVCEAIQHAHQKGIIHRDLKPSNILVSADGDEDIPKIIDFGVAKAIAGPLTERTLKTEDSRLLGTPEYMSPEQADMAGEDIDTRADIYSLGVLLYVLLAGVLPFDPQTFREGGIDRIRKLIREGDPKTPSTRLGETSAEDSTESARRRGTNAKALQRRLHGDLDWITLKAMEKDRTRRYGSAGELAADVCRHLNHEPVSAGPPSTVYKVSKFVRRNRALVTGVATVLLVLITGIVVSMFALGQARARAEEAQTVSEFLRNTVLSSLDPYDVAGRTITTRSALDAISEDIAVKLRDYPLAEAEIRERVGFLYWSLGLYEQAEPHYKRAIEIYRARLGMQDATTLNAMTRLGWVYFYDSRYDEAKQQFIEALEGMQIVLGDKDVNTLHVMAALGGVYYMQGRFNEAEQLCPKALETMQRRVGDEDGRLVNFICTLAVGYRFQGRYAEAEELYNRGLAISRREFGEQHWSTLMLMQTFGQLCCDLGRYDEAEQLLLADLEGRRDSWGREHPDTLWTMACLGWLYYHQGRYEEAELLFVTAMENARRTLREAHLCCLHAMRGLGRLYVSQGRYDEAEPLLLKVLEIAPGVVGDEQWGVLSTRNTLARLYTAQGRYDEAQELCTQVLAVRRRNLGDEHPATLESVNDSGVLRREQQWYEEAESLLRQALEGRQRKLGPDHPACFESMHELGVLYIRQACYEEAEPLLLEAFHGREAKLGPAHPHTLDSLKQLVSLYESWPKPDEAAKWRAKLPESKPASE